MTLQQDWQHTESLGQCTEIPSARCILDLRGRVEALEAAQREAAMDELRKASADLQPIPEAAPVATDEELDRTFLSTSTGLGGLRACYDLGREHGAAAAQSALTAMPLIWTENLPPNEECRYDHCKADTPFGRFLITWKSWKQCDSPTVDETPWGDFWSAFESIERAKEDCQKEYEKRLRDCCAAPLAAAQPAPPAAPAPAGGLVERVMVLLGHHGDGTARAAIREVAAWMEENGSPLTAEWLREEADRG